MQRRARVVGLRVDHLEPNPEGIITGGHGNKAARTVAVYEGEALDTRALQTMFEQIIANSRAGGWRRLKREDAR